ncbi:MAG: hypothetical protein IPQ08_06115 [Chitinophagaceae bacterium]|nr:hypothetical protein [Chitinophagaceae bacterium]
MARPKGSGQRNLTDAEIEQIKTMSGLGLTQRQIGLILKMPLATFETVMRRDPRVRPALEEGVAIALKNVTQTAYQMAISGKVPAMTMFYLKTRAGWRETQAIELTGGNGGPLELLVAPKQLQRELDELKGKYEAALRNASLPERISRDINEVPAEFLIDSKVDGKSD